MTDIAIDTVRTIRGADMPTIPPAVHHFDMLRSLGVLAHDPKLNEGRWRVGVWVRTSHRWIDLETTSGPECWPIIKRIVIDGATAAECADLVPETQPHHVCAVVLDRLRVTLDRLAREFPEL